jgi:hypothetical protein
LKSGGSVLTALLNSKHPSVKDLAISALVRGDDKAKVLLEQGVNPIQFRDLDDSEALTKAASEHDSKLQCGWYHETNVNFADSCHPYCLGLPHWSREGTSVWSRTKKEDYRTRSLLLPRKLDLVHVTILC